MRLKKVAKIGIITFVVVAAVLFLAFTTFVYNPFEGRFGDIRRAIPSTVDLFASKRELRSDFSAFPQPKVWERLERGATWGRIKTSPLYRGIEAKIQSPLAQLSEFQRRFRAVPLLGLDILGDCIGKDLAVAAVLRADQRSFDFCGYSRVSWKIRTAIGLLGYDAVRSRLQGVDIAVESEGVYRIAAPGAEHMWLTRVLDLAIVGNSKDLLTRSRNLALGLSEEYSMFESADYNDELKGELDDWRERYGQDPNAVTSMLNVEMLRRYSPGFATWPSRQQNLSIEEKLIDAFLSQSAMRRLWASVVFDREDAISVLAHLNVNHGALESEFQKRFHAEQSGNVERWLTDFLERVPSSAAVAAALRVPPSLFLTELFLVLDRDSKELLEGAVRRGGYAGGVRGLVERLAPGLEPWVGIIFRNNNYPPIENEFKVYVPSPAPAAAIVLRAVRGQERRIHKLIEAFQTKLRFEMGFEGKDWTMFAGPKRGGRGEIEIREWENRHIPATGQIALFFDDDPGTRSSRSRYFIVSTSGKLLREIINARYRLDGTVPLSTDGEVQDCLRKLPNLLSGFAWLRGDQVLGVIDRYQSFARERIRDEGYDVGWAAQVRPNVAREVFEANFRGKYPSQAAIPPGGRDGQRFETLIDQRLRSLWSTERVRLRQDLDLKFGQAAQILDYLHSGFLALRAGTKALRLESRFFLRL